MYRLWENRLCYNILCSRRQVYCLSLQVSHNWFLQDSVWQHWEIHVRLQLCSTAGILHPLSGLTLGLDDVPDMSPNERTKLKLLRKTNHIKALKYLAFLLPPLNFKLFKELLELLRRIADNDETNKMSASNLGVIFAPHVLWPRYVSLTNISLHCKLRCVLLKVTASCVKTAKSEADMKACGACVCGAILTYFCTNNPALHPTVYKTNVAYSFSTNNVKTVKCLCNWQICWSVRT